MRRQGKRTHFSMRGKPVDMDALRARNEGEIAVGNARMNARGDILSRTGEIEVKREEISKTFHDTQGSIAQNVSLKPAMPDVFETPEQALARLAEIANSTEEVKSKSSTSSKPSNKKTRNLVDKND